MIVQRIIRDHSGRIDIESKPGEGTTFRAWLPLHPRGLRLLGAGQPESGGHGAVRENGGEHAI
jgi:hypothetical protein